MYTLRFVYIESIHMYREEEKIRLKRVCYVWNSLFNIHTQSVWWNKEKFYREKEQQQQQRWKKNSIRPSCSSVCCKAQPNETVHISQFAVYQIISESNSVFYVIGCSLCKWFMAFKRKEFQYACDSDVFKILSYNLSGKKLEKKRFKKCYELRSFSFDFLIWNFKEKCPYDNKIALTGTHINARIIVNYSSNNFKMLQKGDKKYCASFNKFIIGKLGISFYMNRQKKVKEKPQPQHWMHIIKVFIFFAYFIAFFSDETFCAQILFFFWVAEVAPSSTHVYPLSNKLLHIKTYYIFEWKTNFQKNFLFNRHCLYVHTCSIRT